MWKLRLREAKPSDPGCTLELAEQGQGNRGHGTGPPFFLKGGDSLPRLEELMRHLRMLGIAEVASHGRCNTKS